MSILADKETRVVFQGITGSEGSFHTKACMDYGTHVVAGVTPGKGGQLFEGSVPVYNRVADAKEKKGQMHPVFLYRLLLPLMPLSKPLMQSLIW